MAGEVENSDIRDLTYVLGVDGDGLFGRESVDALKAGASLSAVGRKWGFAGDSITNGSSAANTIYAFPYQSCVIAGMAHNYPATIAGVPGNRSDQILDRMEEIIATGIDGLVVLAGTNDAGDEFSMETYIANMTAIILRARRAGLPCIVCTVPPIGAGEDIGGRQKTIDSQNMWIRMIVPRLGARIADIHAALVDPATGYYQAAYNNDDIHPTSLGHFAIAEVLGPVMASFQPALPLVSAVNPSEAACIANPLLAGTIGDGNLPTGWYQQPGYPSGSGSAAYGVRAKSGSLHAGQWFEVSVDATSGDVTTIFGVSLEAGSYAVGDTLAVTCRREIEDIGGNWRATAGGSQLGGATVNLNNSGANLGPAWVGSAALLQPPSWSVDAAPATGLTVWFIVTATSGQKFKARIGELQVYNLTEMGLDELFGAW